jgi:hypothetical protein
MRKIFEKNFRRFQERNPHETLVFRLRIFVILSSILIALSKIFYINKFLPPNVELIIPTLSVVGSFSIPLGQSRFWRIFNKYFGVITLITVFLTDIFVWGFYSIYIFTWSGFIFVWLLSTRNQLSFFDKYTNLVKKTIITTAISILLFDFWTGIIGTTLMGWNGSPASIDSWIKSAIGQIPFTLYHLLSLIFVLPLLAFGKFVSRIKIAIPIAVPTKIRVGHSNKK